MWHENYEIRKFLNIDAGRSKSTHTLTRDQQHIFNLCVIDAGALGDGGELSGYNIEYSILNWNKEHR